MASTVDTSPLDPGGGETLEHFHCFPDLPPEIRIEIWQKAYRALHYSPVYRFRLKFSQAQDTGEEEKPKAFLVPLEEVGYLTRELRSLRRVNSEALLEGDRFFGRSIYSGCGYLRFNQTDKGDTTDICSPINLPWRGMCDLFCFVDLTESDVLRLKEADTSLIDHVFSQVEAVGLGLDRTLEAGDQFFEPFADFLSLFRQLQHASLVSDLLMSEADLDNICDDIRSDYLLSSWSGWDGMVPEGVFGSDCEDANIVTKDQHLEVLADFTDAMYDWGETFPKSASALLRTSYGMMFRTKECLDFLLWSDDVLDDITEEQGLLDEFFSDDASGELFSEDFEEPSEEDEGV
ncbi:hypothetical protein KVR01_010336 [Diaporthe batatas]|uniref:uncharacterized protein n=1 Tax=Diaporthe batatas TaxID=748121 RepID=UPI001D045105|nr:uncharacterized protein KVR01_010336 [Diaporthe batatas]KAG8159699.1 hypothetical protein KVR01_010336 [Diaporthe batatas]